MRRHVGGLDGNVVRHVADVTRRLERRGSRGDGHGNAGDRDARPASRRNLGVPVEHGAQLLAVLRPLIRPDRKHPGHRLQEARRDARNDAVLQLIGIVLHGTRGGRRRRRPEQQVVDDGTQSVEIGPRPLPHLRHLGVLLDRCVARLQDRRERLRTVADDAAGGAEIEQHRRAVGRKQDVVGRDVAVIDAFPVQQLERRQDRRDDAPDPCLVGRMGHAAPGVAQGHALKERHHHVGGGVVFPEPVDLDQRRMVEARQQPRLVDEGAQADGVGFGERARTNRDLRALAARRQRCRHVLLQRHLALERVVLRQVDDAEAADAEHAQDLEFAETRARRQSVVVHARGGSGRSARRRRHGIHRRG